jgi:uncharacterized membrane protein YccF (DUF307 family)
MLAREVVMANSITLQTKSGPGFLIRAVWFVLVGWWLTGIMSVIAWFAMVSIIGLPLGIYLINRIPTFITLRPRTNKVTATMVGGRVVVERSKLTQQPWYIRFVWFVLVGWWASAAVMAVGWLLVVLILTLPIGLMLYNRVPFVASLYRY